MADKDEKEEAVYTKSTAELDLEARLGDESDPPVFNAAENPNPFHEEGYVGVSDEYANAANEVDEPYDSEEGGFADAEKAFAEAYGDSSGEVTPQMEEAVAKVTRDDVGPEAEAAPAKATTTTTKKTAAKTSESSS